jgi:transcription initiation factor IIF auxiliary subunit
VPLILSFQSFPNSPSTDLKKPPFLLQERGWGEFDMEITLNFIDKAGTQAIRHDLHFQETRYENDHKIVSWAAGGTVGKKGC